MFSNTKSYTQEVIDLLRISEDDCKQIIKDSLIEYKKQAIELLEMMVGYNTIICLLILYIFYLKSGFCFSFYGFCVCAIIFILSDFVELNQKKKFIQVF